MYITQTVNFDIEKKLTDKIKVKQGDSNSWYVAFNLIRDGAALNLTGSQVILYALKPDGNVVYDTCTISDAPNGTIIAEFTYQAIAIDGDLECEFVIIGSDNSKLSTTTFIVNVLESVNNDDAIESTSEYSALTEGMSKLEGYMSYFDDIAVNIKSYAIDGQTTWDTALQNAYTYLQLFGGGTVYFPKGIYLFDGTIYPPSYITLLGEGDLTILQAGDNNYSMINLGGMDYSNVINLKLDGRAKQRTLTKAVYGIKMGRAQHCKIDNVTLTNLGYTTDPNTGGNFLDMSIDDTYETNGGGRDACYNTIQNCRFIDADGISSFAIRLWTTWLLGIDISSYKYYVRDNVVRNNYFSGFTWNMVELAGAVTQRNRIEGNLCENHVGYGCIEADKGASYNLFVNNVVRNILPLATPDSQFAYRDAVSTTVSKVGGGTIYYRPIGNMWIGNRIDGVTQNGTTTSGGMILSNSQGCIIDGMQIMNIKGSAVDTIAGIVVEGASSDFVIKNCRIDSARTGIYLTSAIDGTVSGNVITNCYYGIKTSADAYNIGIRDNVFKTITATGVNLSSPNTNISIVANEINGAYTGIRTGASTTLIQGNVLLNITDTMNGIDARQGQHVIIGNRLVGSRLYTEGDFHTIFGNVSDSTSSTWTKRVTYGTAIPSTDKWKQGDIKYNASPASGGYIGWVCTTTGTACTTAWAASTAYAVGAIVYSGTKVYTCTVAGTSGTIAPTFSSGTATDGTVTWSYTDALAVFKTFGLIS